MCDVSSPMSRSRHLIVGIALISLAVAGTTSGQDAGFVNPDFEIGEPGQSPTGWSFARVLTERDFTALLTDENPQSGRLCVEIRWPTGKTPTSGIANFRQSVDATPWRGKRIKVTAAVRIEATTPDSRAQMWLRVDRLGGVMGAFDNMYDRPIRSEAWADHSIMADVDEDARKINLGLLVYEGATAWWDNVRVEVVGDFETPMEPPGPLSEAGLANLVAFTRLLGYVRHFHPSDQAAEIDWLRFAIEALPKIEAARDAETLAAEIQAAFAPIAPTVRVFPKHSEPAIPRKLKPPPGMSPLRVRYWEHYGYSSSEKPTGSALYYSRRFTLLTPDIDSLPDYARPENVYRSDLNAEVSCIVPTALLVDALGTYPRPEPHPMAMDGDEHVRYGLDHRRARLATIMTAWNILQHFYPYFDVMDIDWPHELEVALGKAAVDSNEVEFYQTLNRLIVALQDGHGSLSGPGMPNGRPLPLVAELMGDQVVVVNVAVDVNDIHPGDVIERIDGRPAREAFAEVQRQVSTSTPQRIGRLNFGFGWRPQATEAKLELRGADGRLHKVTVTRSRKEMDTSRPPKLHKIEPGIFYVDITRLAQEDFDGALPQLEKAKALIFDMRGYPRISPTWLTHLSPHRLQSAHWYIPKAHRPDHTDMEWHTSRWNLDVGQPQLTANRVFLTDGSAMSYAESLMGIVEAYKLGEIVGEPTAGTNGNVCRADLPLGYTMGFTGMKVLKHDGTRHHGVGILPTVPVSRTIQGIREGRDEQLERALGLLR